MLDITQPPPHVLVAASILSADFGRMADDVADVLVRGVDLLHIDVMDGHFAPNLTMGQDMIKGVRRHFPDTYLDVHLMVEHPEDYIESFAAAGANMFTFHVEVSKPMRPGGVNPAEMIKRVRGEGMNVGMVINPPTPAESVEPWLDDLDMVLVMSVNPGRSGQAFMPEVLDKARWLSECVNRHTRIEMDGGLNSETCEWAAEAGVDVMVTASALFGAAERSTVIQAMHAAKIN